LGRRPLDGILFGIEVLIIEDIRGFRTEGKDGGSWRELEAESVTMGAGDNGGFGNNQWRDMNTRGTPWSVERVERFVVNNAADPRLNDVLGAGLVGEVRNNVEHPVPETEVLCRWSSNLVFSSSSVSSRIAWTLRSFSAISWSMSRSGRVMPLEAAISLK
jgi:hypothetical protein